MNRFLLIRPFITLGLRPFKSSPHIRRLAQVHHVLSASPHSSFSTASSPCYNKNENIDNNDDADDAKDDEPYVPLSEREKDAIMARFPPAIGKLFVMYLDSAVLPTGQQIADAWDEQDAFRHKQQLKDEVYDLLSHGKVELSKMAFDEYYEKYLLIEEEYQVSGTEGNLTSRKSRQHVLIDAVLLGYYGMTMRQFDGQIDNAIELLLLSMDYFDMYHAREKDFSDEQFLEEIEGDEKVRKGKEKKRRKNVRRMEHMVSTALGVLYFSRDEFDSAKRCFERALASMPKDERSLFMLALIGRYKMDYAEAEKYYMLLEEHYGEKNPNLLGDIACFYMDCMKDFAKAEEKLQKALEMDPKHSNNWYTYAILCMHGYNDFMRAEEYFQKAIDADKEHSPSLAKYGMILTMREEYERARGLLKRSIDYDPFQTDTLCNLAHVEHQLGQLQESEETFKRALKQWKDEAALYERQNKIKADRKKGVDNHSNAGTSPLPVQELGRELYNVAILHLNYANLLCDMKKYRRAEEMYMEALKVQPDNISALGNYAMLLDILERDQSVVHESYNKAVKTFEAMLASNESASKEHMREILLEFGGPHKNNLDNFALYMLEVVKDESAAISQYAKIIDYIEKYELPVLGEQHVANQLVILPDYYRRYAKLMRSRDAALADKLRQRSAALRAKATATRPAKKGNKAK